jgi:CheY-like chemotaxis protein
MTSHPIILCVDDDPDDRDMIRDVLQAANPQLHVVEAGDGREALDYLRTKESLAHPPSLIILDMNMPRLSGRETLAILKSEAETESIPVVVFTTSSAIADSSFCQRFGVKMITKPPTYEALKEVAQHFLAQIAEPNTYHTSN